MTPIDLAEVGYRAYGDAADWTNFAGNPMPSWGELPGPQRDSWVEAAAAIRQAVLNGRGGGRGAPSSGSNTGGRA